MTPLPVPTIGVISAAVGFGGVIHDPRAGQLHTLNPTGWAIWQACQAGLDENAAARALARETHTDLRTVADGVRSHVEQLGASGLVEGEPWQPPPPLPTPVRDGSLRYRVLAEVVEVRLCLDEPRCHQLEHAIARLLEPMGTQAEATVSITISAHEPHGFVIGGAGPDQHHNDQDALLETLPSALNRIAERSTRCLALHAGAVSHADGRTVVLPALSGDGKSTLTAELVTSGWNYLSDEAAGIDLVDLHLHPYAKPLVLDATSRQALSLSPISSVNTTIEELGATAAVDGAGPATTLILPVYAPNASPTVTVLGGVDAVAAVAEHALNLRYCGQRGLDALVRLVESVPCRRLRHRGGASATAMIGALSRLATRDNGVSADGTVASSERAD